MHFFKNLVLLLFFVAVSTTAYSRHVIEIGAVEGRVIDETTQTPLGNVAILMRWELRVLTFPQARSGGYVYFAQATTDSEGKFRLASSKAIDISRITQNVELGEADVWVFLEGFRPVIDNVSYRTVKKGFPFFTITHHANIDKKLFIPLKKYADVRAEFFGIGELLSLGSFYDYKDACNDPTFGAFLYKLVQRQSQLRSQAGNLRENLLKEIDCNGHRVTFYPYSG